MERFAVELLERGVSALEKLVQQGEEDLEIKVETQPPVCPHCGTMNPTVRVDAVADSGPLAEFVTQAFCKVCNNVFYMIPIQTICVKTTNEAHEVIEQRVRMGGYERENQAATA